MKQFLREWLGIEKEHKNNIISFSDCYNRISDLEKRIKFLEDKLGLKEEKKDLPFYFYTMFSNEKTNKTLKFLDRFNKLLEHLKLEWVDEETNIKPAHFKSKK